VSPPRIFATYELQTPLELERAVAVLAGEASTGTFVPVPGEDPELRERFGMRLERVERPTAGRATDAVERHGSASVLSGPASGELRSAQITVSLPTELTGTDLVTLLASVAGNVTELREVTRLRLLELELPDEVIAAAPRPALSVAGLRRLTAAYLRPVRATSVSALTRDQDEGPDLLLDDQIAADPPGRPLADRLATASVRAGEHGIPTALTITDSADTMFRHAERVARAGGGAVQVCGERVGVSAVIALRRRCDLAILSRPAGFGLRGRCGAGGIAFAAWQQLWRLAGADALEVPYGADPSVCLQPLAGDEDRALPIVPAARESTASVDCMVVRECG